MGGNDEGGAERDLTRVYGDRDSTAEFVCGARSMELESFGLIGVYRSRVRVVGARGKKK
jgi:hypothetical protein